MSSTVRWSGRRLASSVRSMLGAMRRVTLATGAGKISRAATAPDLFERLEQRSLMAGTPLPTLAQLESPNNSVVRFETSLGDIDIELFNNATPNTVANFLNYTTSGRYDNSFFHRSAHNEPQGTNPQPGSPRPTQPRDRRFVLQGGGFLFDDRRAPELRGLATDAPINQEGVPRSNTERTLSMARLGQQPDSATSQFFFNLGDNNFLDTVDGAGRGFTVFARVIQGWDVVLAISDLQRWNLTNNSAFASATGGAQGAMSEVPVLPGYAGGAVTNSTLVTINNAEIIKPANFAGFFASEVFMPEGQRTNTATETLRLTNPNNVTASYQVIVRYESGLRDNVIASGSLNAGTSLTIPVSSATDQSIALIRSDAPYSIVVQSALTDGATEPRPLAASFDRTDFGSDTSENFYDRAGLSDAAMQTWTFARVERNALSREFVVWQSLSDQPATVQVNFFTTTGQQTANFIFNLDAYRRGGVEFFSLGLADGLYAVRVTSTRPIVAMLSDWDIATPRPTPVLSSTPGWSTIGTNNPGTFAAIGEVSRRDGWQNTLSLFNNTDNPSSVTIFFPRTGGGGIERSQVVFARSRLDVDIDAENTAVPVGERFGIRLISAEPVSAQLTSINTATRNNPGPRTDGSSTFLSSAVGSFAFLGSGGLSDPARAGTSLTETVSVYNPFVLNATTGTFSFRLRYHFADGTTIDTGVFTPDSQSRIDILTNSVADVFAKINSGAQFRSYGISVLGQVTQGVTTTPVAGVAQLTRVDTENGTAFTANAQYSGTMRQLSNSFFTDQGGI
jgi:cyclophilin family peptidyl-prolyl cis-trans isomerase